MNKKFFLFISILFLTLATSSAAVYKGQKIFVKECVKCHASGQVFVATQNMKDWKKLMNKNGKGLADLHLGKEKAKDSWEYFDSSIYAKKTKHLEQFLVEYAKDSGNVPACN
ncbi:cytochrome C [bacterium]|nr:cytochrome C [bacterium]MBU1993729.1 cytochrome C [bacterium]